MMYRSFLTEGQPCAWKGKMLLDSESIISECSELKELWGDYFNNPKESKP